MANIPKDAHIIRTSRYVVNVWGIDAHTRTPHELGDVECQLDEWSDGYDEWHFVRELAYAPGAIAKRAKEAHALKGFAPLGYFNSSFADSENIARVTWTSKEIKED